MARPITSECLMTTREVARFLCVVPKTVHRWRRRRGLPFFRVSRSAGTAEPRSSGGAHGGLKDLIRSERG